MSTSERIPAPLTKIVATVGPASDDETTLGRLLDAGVSVFRLNFSHGSQENHAHAISRLRALAADRVRPIALLGDLQGPKLRVGDLAGGGPVTLTEGAEISIVTEPVVGTAARISTTHDRLADDVQPGTRLLLDDGAMELRVEQVVRDGQHGDEVICRVIQGGLLHPQKSINLPGVAVSVPCLTEKDLDDLAFAVAQGVDYIALSFVRSPDDLKRARAEIRRLGGHQPLIAKIEKPEAVARLEEVIRASDGVMVARGDLGVELSPEQVPMLQKRMIRLANEVGVPVITATQMLESMIVNSRPTRAEASDVANAILDGTDAVMLSGETAVGAHPVAAVQVMVRITRETERAPIHDLAQAATHALAHTLRRVSQAQAAAHAARSLAHDLGARAIAVLTATGRTAQRVSKERPGVPVIAFTDRPEVARRLALWHGVIPVVMPLTTSTDAVIGQVDVGLREGGYATTGDAIVIVGSTPRAQRTRSVFLELHQMG